MTFKNAALNTPVAARTENGMKAQADSLRATVDFFYNIGTMRGRDVSALFERAYAENRDYAIRLAQWARDVRGGAGERKIFRDILVQLEKLHTSDLTDTNLLKKVAEVGRYDDLLVFQTPKVKDAAFRVIAEALLAGNGLAAKWMPRKGKVAEELRAFLNLSPKKYRKLLVNLTKVVETQMCNKDWDAINFGHVPSQAARIYTKAFAKNAPEAYNAYKEGLEKGTEKINAGAVYPYQVVQTLRTDLKIADAMWNALPNFMTDANILPVVDVSGSMTTPAAGIKNVSCMDIALSLGLYCADKNQGAFKDMFVTFTDVPKIEVLQGNLSSKIAQMKSRVGYNTNLHAVFDRVLEVAQKHAVPEEDMPKAILLLSDMQFDGGWNRSPYDESAIEMIRRKYSEAGYKVPMVVFWNLADGRGSAKNSPVSFDSRGTALVSGFSPSIMKSILAFDLEDTSKFTPEAVMLETILSERYDF